MTHCEVSDKFEGKIDLGIIGGTGLYQLDCLKPIARLDPIVTPWGVTSSPITVAKYILKEDDDMNSDSEHVKKDFYVAFLSRHGLHHEYPPSRVPFRANIAALKHLDCKAVISFSAVGSLREEIKPRDFILPQQIIDRTKGIRESSYFNDVGLVGHVGFGDPFSSNIANFINDLVKESFNVDPILVNQDTNEPCDLHFDRDMTVVCMEGPQFSTRAESKMYRMLGGDVINMSVLPEAKLARECELPYQMICMSTDYDAWMDHEEPVSVESVLGHLNNNGRNANRLATKIIEKMAKSNPKFLNNGDGLAGSIKMSISTKPDAMSKETLEKLRFLFPDYW